eukprot:5256017-Pleurochrysis_carterae.AAC.1
MTTTHVSRNLQVPALFLIFARFFRIKLPIHRHKVPHKVIDGKMTHVKKELLYVPGKTHVKEKCDAEPGPQAPGRHAAARGRRRLLLQLRRRRVASDRVPRPAAFPLRCRRQLEGDGAQSDHHASEQDVGGADRGVQEVAARDGQAHAQRWHHRDHRTAHSRLCPGVDNERPGRYSAQGSLPCERRRRDRRRRNVRAPDAAVAERFSQTGSLRTYLE